MRPSPDPQASPPISHTSALPPARSHAQARSAPAERVSRECRTDASQPKVIGSEAIFKAIHEEMLSQAPAPSPLSRRPRSVRLRRRAQKPSRARALVAVPRARRRWRRGLFRVRAHAARRMRHADCCSLCAVADRRRACLAPQQLVAAPCSACRTSNRLSP